MNITISYLKKEKIATICLPKGTALYSKESDNKQWITILTGSKYINTSQIVEDLACLIRQYADITVERSIPGIECPKEIDFKYIPEKSEDEYEYWEIWTIVNKTETVTNILDGIVRLGEIFNETEGC